MGTPCDQLQDDALAQRNVSLFFPLLHTSWERCRGRIACLGGRTALRYHSDSWCALFAAAALFDVRPFAAARSESANLADFVFPSLLRPYSSMCFTFEFRTIATLVDCRLGHSSILALSPWRPAPAAITTAGGAMRWPLSLLWYLPKADTMPLSVSGEHFAQPMPLPSSQRLPLYRQHVLSNFVVFAVPHFALPQPQPQQQATPQQHRK